MTALERLKLKADDAKINAWLDHIGETCQATRSEIIESCAKDKDARSYFVERYERRGAHDAKNNSFRA